MLAEDEVDVVDEAHCVWGVVSMLRMARRVSQLLMYCGIRLSHYVRVAMGVITPFTLFLLCVGH